MIVEYTFVVLAVEINQKKKNQEFIFYQAQIIQGEIVEFMVFAILQTSLKI